MNRVNVIVWIWKICWFYDFVIIVVIGVVWFRVNVKNIVDDVIFGFCFNIYYVFVYMNNIFKWFVEFLSI